MYTDPSGYKVVYDWETGEYKHDGKVVTFEYAMAYYGISYGGGVSDGGSAYDFFQSIGGINSGFIAYSINGYMITGAERWFWVKFFSHFGTNTFLEPSRNTTPPSFEPFDPENLLASTDKQIKPPSDKGQGGGVHNRTNQIVEVRPEKWEEGWQPLAPDVTWDKPFDAVKAHGVIIKVNNLQSRFSRIRISITVVDITDENPFGFIVNSLAMHTNAFINFSWAKFGLGNQPLTIFPANTPGWE